MGSKHLVVDDETFELVMSKCVREYYESNPKQVGMRMTQNFMIRRIAEHYLET